MSEGLLSWGAYPRLPQRAHDVDWRDELPDVLVSAAKARGTTLAYGEGRSYGDSCLADSGHVLTLRALDHFLFADWSNGILRAEAGVTLESILAAVIPHGWFLPVTPGTKYVSLGGAIANDVHGKNHHRRGTFGRHVRRLGLLRSDRGRVVASPETEPELFAATVGGLGLTGIIEWAEIQLSPIRSSQIDGISVRFGDLDEFFALSEELDAQHEFCVSWVDCVARGKKTGRGVYMAGNFAADGRRAVENRRRLTFPFTPPVSLVNACSLRAFNTLYWRKASSGRRRARMAYEPFFYPLDTLLKWNRIYGTGGFQQYQALIPESEARAGIHALLAAIAQSGVGSFLAVLKRCGDIASPGLLSFPRAGVTLALDFPQTRHLEPRLFSRLDAIVRAAGGRLYPAKDAHMRGEDFRRAYPLWEKIEALRDPLLLSRFWRRVNR
ncbi:MAG: FAD-binding oxidoreductase [Zoogloeaceae bacterium]|jgi:FAD/FMN-containing dehydrogenase|nr:FAD-binding oxidoreductase [Zoogloeaceae bacterium]